MDREAPAPLVAAVAPDGRVYVERRADAPALDPAADARIDAAFARGGGAGLLHLGAAEVGTHLPAGLGFFRDLAARLVAAVCRMPDAAEVPPPTDELASLARGV